MSGSSEAGADGGSADEGVELHVEFLQRLLRILHLLAELGAPLQGQAHGQHVDHHQVGQAGGNRGVGVGVEHQVDRDQHCLLYTSDAADE